MKGKLWAAIALLSIAACDDSSTAPAAQATYVVQVGTEQFKVRANGTAAAALDARMQAGTIGVISGKLMRGNGGFNAPFSWHLDPASIHAPDLAIEVCDGRPSDIDQDINYWIDTVKQYCPWGAKVVAKQ
jgi:hypothetical protein